MKFWIILILSLSISVIYGQDKQPKKFVFKKSIVSNESGISNLESKTDSLIDTSYKPNGKDSVLNRSFKEIQMTKFLTQTPETEIYVEIENDSIWRFTKQKGRMIGDYFMIKKNNGILNYYDKSKSINYKKHDLFAHNDKYQIIKNRKDRKEIKGFDCYKLTIIKKDKESDLGNTVYEMYVTEQIELPIHSVLNLSKLIPNIFPMEIKIWGEKLSGIIEFYELIEIE
ncbi:hypothetical protein [uncultured Polaribacter sp.]|uniref:hypothetical protein n=1 Tax=uncultured Polaribacter sp. TaxID=174711 RepID=UPI00260CCDB9|nr:hypothetical protein [uncultured Polaribacter sp.]